MTGTSYSRRSFLRDASAAGILLGLGASSLAGCGRQPSMAQSTAAPTGAPKPGGTLRIGMVGAGKGESFDPSAASSALINVAMTCAVFDPLITYGPDMRLRPALATSWTSDASGSAWTFKLRQGVAWHDGKPFTADDVIYSFQWMETPGSGLGPAVANIDTAKVSKKDPNTVVVPLKSPDPRFPETIALAWIVQAGAKDFTKPVGTGPFTFVSLDQGQQSVCKRNPVYWDTGKPYVDELRLLSLKDDTARLNALLSGQTDVMAQLPYAQAKSSISEDFWLLRSPGLTAQAFYMAVDEDPFTDPRIRQALRLLVDRQQLVDVALNGFGTVANDLYGRALPYFDVALPQRTRDVAKAKDLLAQAGHASGLTLRLQTSAAAPGMVEAATLFQQQAKDAGVTVKISQVDPDAYFDPTRDYLTMPFAQTVWQGITSLGSFYQTALLKGAPGNETHWTSPHTADLIGAATSAPDDASARTAWDAVQQEQYDSGGYIWWGNCDNLDAASKKVGGIVPGVSQNLGLPTSLAEAYFVA